ncbi:MAG: FixH family protein, partial [Flavobacterium stagni]
MKINWGTGIVIAFALFMSFILFFVFRVQSNSKYDNELVVEKYYLKEQTFERDLEKENNALSLNEKVQCTKTEEGIDIAFPQSFEFAKINGKVFVLGLINDFKT